MVSMSSYPIQEMLRLQGLPEDWLDHQPWTMQAKRKMVGNGVALPMARAIADAVVRALGLEAEGIQGSGRARGPRGREGRTGSSGTGV